MSSLEGRTALRGLGPLHRLSALMCVVVVVGGVLAELALAWVWLSASRVETLVAPRLGLTGYTVTLDVSTRLAGFALSMIPMCVLFIMLHQAFRLFDAYRAGHVFTEMAPIRLRRIGLCMLGLAALRPITATLLGLLLTLANPPGQRILAIGLSIDDYMIAAFGGLILAIGHVMAEAKRLADDHEQIV